MKRRILSFILAVNIGCMTPVLREEPFVCDGEEYNAAAVSTEENADDGDIEEIDLEPVYRQEIVPDDLFKEEELWETETPGKKREPTQNPDASAVPKKVKRERKDGSAGLKEIEALDISEKKEEPGRAASDRVVGCTSWDQVKSAVESGKGKVRIDANISATGTVTVPSGSTVVIFPKSSENYSITRSASFVGGALFRVKGTLTIEASSAVNPSTGARTLLSVKGRQSTMYAGAPLLTVDGGTLNLAAGYLGWNSFLKDPGNPGILSGDGGCVRVNSGAFHMTGGVIEQSAALNGGGVSVQYGASFTMSGGQIVGNRTAQSTREENDTTGNGGGVAVYGTFVMTGGTIGGDFTSGGNVFRGNTADFAGGVAIISGTAAISGGTISRNAATKHGGGLHLYGERSAETGRLDVTGGIISENTAPRGGGIFLSTRGMLNIGTSDTAPVISRNTSTTTTNEFGGGGIYASKTASGFTIQNGIFDGNAAVMHGGAVATQAETSVSGGRFVRNSAKSGGAIRSSGNLLVSGGLFGGGSAAEGNTAGDSGAAIAQSGGNTMTLSGGTIAYNSGGIGALFVASNGRLSMRGGEIHSNANTSGIAVNGNASTSGVALISGGTIYGNGLAGIGNSGSVTVEGTAVIRNNATYGIINNGNGTLRMENGRIFSNGNAAFSSGGGIYNGGTAAITGGAVYGNAGYGFTNTGACQVNGHFMVGLYSYAGAGDYASSANYSGCIKNSGNLTAGGLLAYGANAPCLENTGNVTFNCANAGNGFFSLKTSAVVCNAGKLYIGAKSPGASFSDTLIVYAREAENGIDNSGELVCGGLYVDGEYGVTESGIRSDNNFHIKTGIRNTGTGRYDAGSFAQAVSLCDYAEIKNCLESGIDNVAGTVKVWGNVKIHSNRGNGIQNAAAFAMAGGTVEKNGTGLSNSGAIRLTGGSITGNGTGVYQDGTFFMSGAAAVSEDNDVKLPKGRVITVEGALTTDGAVAVATPLNRAGKELPGITSDENQNEGGLGRVVAVSSYGEKKGSDALFYRNGNSRFKLSNGGVLRPGDYMDAEWTRAERDAGIIAKDIASGEIVISRAYEVKYHKNIEERDADRSPVNVQVQHLPFGILKYWCENLKLPDGTDTAPRPSVMTRPYADYYEFLNWNTMADGSGVDYPHIFLYKENKPLDLYAQWLRSFNVAYIGNEQTAGEDFTEENIAQNFDYIFSDNLEKNGGKHFKKETTGSYTDAETGEEVTEEITATVVQWSLAKEPKKTEHNYALGERIPAGELYKNAAKNDGAITWGMPAGEYGTYTESVKKRNALFASAAGSRPYVNLYAVWDYGPLIEAYDLYYTLEAAKNTTAGTGITQAELLSRARATDEEDGELPPGAGRDYGGGKKTTFIVSDYSITDFTSLTSDGSVTVNYRAIDTAGNITDKRVTVHIVDTTAEEADTERVRFISKKHLNTLDENSIWRVDAEYSAQLQAVLNNRKKNTETYTGTAFGTNVAFEKPGSGTWETTPEQTWVFSHEQVEEVKAYVDRHGVGNSKSDAALAGFLSRFASCRK